MADTSFTGELTVASIIANPVGAGKTLTTEQTENPFISKMGNLFGTKSQKLAALLDYTENAVLSKAVPVSDEPDKIHDSYSAKLVKACIHSNACEPEEFREMIPMDEKQAKNFYKNMPIYCTEKFSVEEMDALSCVSLLAASSYVEDGCKPEEMGAIMTSHEPVKFTIVHWLFGEAVTERPVHLKTQVGIQKTLTASIFKLISKCGNNGTRKNAFDKIAFFIGDAPKNLDTFTKKVGKNPKRGMKNATSFETLKTYLTSEPQFASEIAEKAGLSIVKAGKILKLAAGENLCKVVTVKNENRKMVAAFYL